MVWFSLSANPTHVEIWSIRLKMVRWWSIWECG